MNQNNLWVVIPAFNEEKQLKQTLQSLTRQENTRFNLVLVDNNSTDRTAEIFEIFVEDHYLEHKWFLIEEIQQGTGAAADTGIRYAIDNGATKILRTDADCIPTANWTLQGNRLLEKYDFVAGKVKPRADEPNYSNKDNILFTIALWIAEWYSPLMKRNKGKEYLTRYRMLSGCNTAITANIYLKSGGFTRTRIEDVHEDHELMNRVRKITKKITFSKKLVIAMSTRRAKAWGIINTLKWYRNHGYKEEIIDIR
jgi:glycosyltransferase involved in cell wall biosynthesis